MVGGRNRPRSPDYAAKAAQARRMQLNRDMYQASLREDVAGSKMQLPDARSFDDGNVAVNRKIGESLDPAARLRPVNFKPVNFCSRSDSQHFARIMRGEIAAATHF